jgi:hypothetical protein
MLLSPKRKYRPNIPSQRGQNVFKIDHSFSFEECHHAEHSVVPKRETYSRHTMTMTYGWYESYRAAALETDWTRMQERVRAAKTTIRERQHVLAEDHGGTPEERAALASAVNSLRVLRGDLVSWRKSVESATSRSEAQKSVGVARISPSPLQSCPAN